MHRNISLINEFTELPSRRKNVPSYCRVAFEYIVSQANFYVQQFGIIKLGEMLLMTEKVDHVI